MGAGQNTIKREQRVKGTDPVMGEERRGSGGRFLVHVRHIMKG